MNTPIPPSRSRPGDPASQSIRARKPSSLNLRLGNPSAGPTTLRSMTATAASDPNGRANFAATAVAGFHPSDMAGLPSAAVTTAGLTSAMTMPPTPHEIADSLRRMSLSRHSARPMPHSAAAGSLPARPLISPLTPHISVSGIDPARSALQRRSVHDIRSGRPAGSPIQADPTSPFGMPSSSAAAVRSPGPSSSAASSARSTPANSPRTAISGSRPGQAGIRVGSRGSPGRFEGLTVSGVATKVVAAPKRRSPGPTEVADLPTEAELIRTFFGLELGRHQVGAEADCSSSSPDLSATLPSNSAVAPEPPVAVVIQDACYAHRYVRPRTSRSILGMVVERPERLRASVLGVAAAYVRLDGCHRGGDRNRDKHRPSVPFRIIKSSRTVPLTAPEVKAVHGAAWMGDLSHLCDEAEFRLGTSGRELDTKPESVGGALHEGDLYLNGQSRAAIEGAIGGVCDGVDWACRSRPDGVLGRAFVCIRPPGHHCGDNTPSGFCWVNNVHVGIQYAARQHGLSHAVIIDFDLHHGDGSQAIAWAANERAAKRRAGRSRSRSEPDDTDEHIPIGYFSVHDINSYPCEDGETSKVQQASLCVAGAHGQTIWNVHLERWRDSVAPEATDESAFWAIYERKYVAIVAQARAFLARQAAEAAAEGRPGRALVFLSAGFDASELESEGMRRHGVGVLTGFYARLTRDVVAMASDSALGVAGVVSVLEGGYSDRALTSGVMAHVSGLCRSDGGLAEWWSAVEIDRLFAARENADVSVPSTVSGSVSTHGIRRSSRNTASTYSSPTQSFVNKVVDPRKLGVELLGSGRRASWVNLRDLAERRRIEEAEAEAEAAAGVAAEQALSSVLSARQSLPDPDFAWQTAAVGLAGLLVPADRPTMSVTFEELNTLQRVRKTRVQRGELSGPATTPPATTADIKSETGSTTASTRSGTRPSRRRQPRVTSPDADEAVRPATRPTRVRSRQSASTDREQEPGTESERTAKTENSTSPGARSGSSTPRPTSGSVRRSARMAQHRSVLPDVVAVPTNEGDSIGSISSGVGQIALQPASVTVAKRASRPVVSAPPSAAIRSTVPTTIPATMAHRSAPTTGVFAPTPPTATMRDEYQRNVGEQMSIGAIMNSTVSGSPASVGPSAAPTCFSSSFSSSSRSTVGSSRLSISSTPASTVVSCSDPNVIPSGRSSRSLGTAHYQLISQQAPTAPTSQQYHQFEHYIPPSQIATPSSGAGTPQSSRSGSGSGSATASVSASGTAAGSISESTGRAGRSGEKENSGSSTSADRRSRSRTGGSTTLPTGRVKSPPQVEVQWMPLNADIKAMGIDR